MRLVTNLKSATGTHKIDVDLNHLKLSAEHKAIATKLFDKIKNEHIDVEQPDQCENDKCLASKYLTPDEFSKIRGIKASLGASNTTAGFFANFCLHVCVV